jgi:hypothetical protein
LSVRPMSFGSELELSLGMSFLLRLYVPICNVEIPEFGLLLHIVPRTPAIVQSKAEASAC